jgi:hypothetical protein
MKTMISGLGEIAENIIASSEKRMNAISDLVKETADMRKRFQQERKQNNIRKHLEDGDKARIHDFGNMMNGITKSIKDMHKDISDLADKTRSMIKKFGQERKHNNIKKHLADGDKARIQDFENMMGGITKSVENIRGEVADLAEKSHMLIKGFHEEHAQMSADWQKMKNIINSKKRNNNHVAAEHKVKVAKEQEKPEKKTPPVKAEKPLTLDEKILGYISKHRKQGVKIGEMEGPLGVAKMKLGKIAKTLMEQGKLIKEDNKYFPAK